MLYDNEKGPYTHSNCKNNIGPYNPLEMYKTKEQMILLLRKAVGSDVFVENPHTKHGESHRNDDSHECK